MTHHWQDIDRHQHPAPPKGKPYRLARLNDAGRLAFYWSAQPGTYAAYIGEGYDRVWGTLTCASGRNMKPENRIFIADYKTARLLQSGGVCRPCGNCNKEEYRLWQKKQKKQAVPKTPRP